MTNYLVLIFIGLALCVDYRLAGAFIVCVGIFSGLVMK
jgi:hypothetical protein